MYSVGTVEVELDVSPQPSYPSTTDSCSRWTIADVQNAPLWIVLLLIFPLALTLTAFLMWIILSLNGMFPFLPGPITPFHHCHDHNLNRLFLYIDWC